MSKGKKKAAATAPATDPKEPRLSLTIPARGKEPMLRQTVMRAVESAGCVIDVVVVDNGIAPECLAGWTPPECVRIVPCDKRGTGQARHAGMLAARCELVVSIDAHVYLGDWWAQNVAATYQVDPTRANGVGVGYVGSLSASFAPEGDCGYHGARLRWMDDTAERRPLVAKWIREPLHALGSDRIGAPMGAFYALTRGWYEAMQQPWARMSSWGCDEEVVALATACLGGEVRMLPSSCCAWHRFESQAIQYSQGEIRAIGENRRRLLHMFPFDAAEVQSLSAWCGYDPELPVEFFFDQDLLAYKEAFADCRGRLVEYLLLWCEGYPEWRDKRSAAPVPSAAKVSPLPAVAAPVPVAQPRPVHPQRLEVHYDVCRQCDGRDTFVVVETLSHLRKYRCKACGQRAWRPRDGEMRFGVNND